MDIPASSGWGDAVDLPQQNCIFWFVPSSSPHHSQNLIPFLAPYRADVFHDLAQEPRISFPSGNG